eukprot:1804133-Pyramimonas_sp.AAC.1
MFKAWSECHICILGQNFLGLGIRATVKGARLRDSRCLSTLRIPFWGRDMSGSEGILWMA